MSRPLQVVRVGGIMSNVLNNYHIIPECLPDLKVLTPSLKSTSGKELELFFAYLFTNIMYVF